MKVEIELSYEQFEPMLISHLKTQYEILLRHVPLGFEDENGIDLLDAYRAVLQDAMLEKDYQKYMHDLAKKQPKYNSKRLTEAEGGL